MEPRVTASTAPAPLPLIYPGSRLRLRTLIFIRWIAVLGQLVAVVAVQAGLDFDVPLVPVAATIGTLALLNLVTALRHRGAIWLRDSAARVYLACDLLQLLVLLGLTGGLQNPFSVLILAPVVVSAATLSRRSTILLSVLAVAGIAALAVLRLPLPWGGAGLEVPQLYVAGILVSLILAVVFIAAYVSSLALEARRMADALGATQLALAREQRLSALGGLAAAAAHELGSPLATIAVVARELEHELPENLPPEHPLREDTALLRSEAERCRRILAELANRPDEDEDTPYHRLPLSALVEAAAQPHAHPGIALRLQFEGPQEAQPNVPRLPELLHGLGTLLQNALQFARSEVTVEIAWNDVQAHITIRDDGPGFDEAVLGELGEPYVSTGSRGRRSAGIATSSANVEQSPRRDRGRDTQTDAHMGLGIFIARNLLAHAGANVSFANCSAGGAEVVIHLPLSHLKVRSEDT
ncbi:ActS/PrrB/RegB family redox-sensitive histidine kinase [Aquibaculum sediminis]|uniref:ActS/PrrB/RegB family redox-sensitive histidine kinase n=1 Tax=Aquibaculum sediminis TaxID=3231907 RepID=UPI0034518B53